MAEGLKKVIVISDSFKGTLSSREISCIAKGVVESYCPDCRVLPLEVADGGEGTVDCFLSVLSGEKVTVPVRGPWGEEMTAAYARFGTTAVVEMASAAGLPLVKERKDPSGTTTYGVGQLMAHAVENGAKKIVLGLGGSATNDGGCGCAAALGCRFLDGRGEEFIPTGGTLKDIADMDFTDLRSKLEGVAVEAMCDVTNPLLGARGAAAIYGPQKGADEAMIQRLDAGLAHLAEVVEQKTGLSVADKPGAGAAGGFGAGVEAFFRGELRPGIEVVLDMLRFDELLKDCDLVITGEGRIDGQSLSGKVPVGVARRAKKQNVPVLAVVGCIRDDAYGAYGEGITAMFNTNRAGRSESELAAHAGDDYFHTIDNIFRVISAAKHW